MSTNINASVLKKFIVRELGATKIDQKEAQSHGIDKKDYKEANVDENDYLDLDEILDSDDIVAMFTAQYEEEVLAENETDKEKEKAVSGSQGKGKA